MVEVEICMGSSCFSRGNSRSLEIIENFIEVNNLQEKIQLTGKLCLGNCSQGPNIIVNNNLHKNCDPDCVVDLVKHYLEGE